MRKFVNILLLNEIKNKYFKISVLIIIIISGLVSYLSIKNYKILDNEILIVEKKLSYDEFILKNEKGDYKNYLHQYDKYIDIVKNHIKYEDTLYKGNLLVIDNIYSIQVFLSLLSIIIGSTLLIKEYKNGSLKYVLTKGFSRKQIYFSYLIVVILLTLILNIILLLSYLLFVLFFTGNFELLTLKHIVINKHIVNELYLLTVIKKYFIYMIPVIMSGIYAFCLSLLVFNEVFSIIQFTLTSILGLALNEWLLNFRVKLLTYTFIPYMDFTIFNNEIEVIKYNMMYGINLNVKNGILILLFYLIIFILFSFYSFIKKDIK